MSNEFDKIDSAPTLPTITLQMTSKEAVAEQFADAVRRAYTEADLRKQAMDLLSEAIGFAKTLI